MRRGFAILTTLLAIAPQIRADDPDLARSMTLLLTEHCLDCHSGPRPKGKLDLTRQKLARQGGKSGPGVVPGKLDESEIWARVRDGEMPPKKPLTDKDKDLVKRWIVGGAPWGDDPIDPFRVTTSKRAGADWWSLQPVKRPTPPPVANEKWTRNPIDHFVLAKLTAAKLTPSPDADRRTLIRRLSFDLIGLPPTPGEVDAFVNDKSDDAYDRLVDRLLRSPHYGERWARHWLDVVRFGESDGFERNASRRNSWHYRNWVIRAFNDDMPYDEFCRLQLAGDVLRPDDLDAVKATGFLVAGIHNTVIPGNKLAQETARQDELEDLVGSVGQTFLGLTVNCGRCHDHKFDPVSQKDYYRLASALSGVNHGERELLTPTSKDEQRRLAAELEKARKDLAALEEPARQAALAAKKAGTVKGPVPPTPLAAWDFRKDANDRLGELHLKATGSVALSPAGLAVDGKSGFMRSVPLTRPLREKTLEAWVRLGQLKQRGGGVITVQSETGDTFDSIVFGEREPGRWMAGSNGFARTTSFNGPEEKDADKIPVHVAITYAGDGTITGYRNGEPYGKPYRTSGPIAFMEGKAVVAFGIRHEPAGGDRLLDGVIVQARLYDRALTPAEIAASANTGEFISDEELKAQLSPDAAARRDQLKKQTVSLATSLDKFKASATLKFYATIPRQPPVTHLLIRGQPLDLGEVVAPGGIPSLSGVTADFGLSESSPEKDRRLKLAEWIASKNNPLFGRVMVNRLWHYHFGVGIVETPNDFGFNGGRPTHPELLDWLAAEFAQRGFRLKEMHRLIVTSSTYRQASSPRKDAAATDADGRLLWRKKPVRMDAETLRDTILAVSGELNPEIGGRGFTDYKERENSGTTYFTPFDPVGREFQRRSVYRFLPRGGDQGLLDAFDCPDPASAAPRRGVTTTPLQALALWNGAFALRMADAMAERLAKEPAERRVAAAYRLAFQREPTTAERDAASRLVEQFGMRALCRALFNANEFLTVE